MKKIGSGRPGLPSGRIVVIVLAVLWWDQRLADLVGGNAVLRTTADRWLEEVVRLLAGRALQPEGHRRRSPIRRAWRISGVASLALN
ncbi:hypothetical protein ACFXKR_40350 [Streptomyces violascens]|uniref:hypothetical protein n=1 Tax=Streptomyces violascens TaxID=67381 RepID=UPI0036CD2D4A